jgi:hypothetical protein
MRARKDLRITSFPPLRTSQADPTAAFSIAQAGALGSRRSRRFEVRNTSSRRTYSQATTANARSAPVHVRVNKPRCGGSWWCIPSQCTCNQCTMCSRRLSCGITSTVTIAAGMSSSGVMEALSRTNRGAGQSRLLRSSPALRCLVLQAVEQPARSRLGTTGFGLLETDLIQERGGA